MSYSNSRARSHFRARGRGRGSFNNRQPPPSNIPIRDLTEGLRPAPFRALYVPTRSIGDAVGLKNLEYVGSYNWIESPADKPTIIVPGSPSQWTDKPTPYDVPADRGEMFADQNGFRLPSATLLPLMVAVDQCSEDKFDWSAIDIVTDRNGLRKLMRWIRGGSDVREFRIDLQLAGKTVLFNRWEKQTKEVFSGYTYGFNFEKATTKKRGDCAGSTGHHRIIRYDLDGLKMVVRFEVDAYLEIPPPQSEAGAARVSALGRTIPLTTVSRETATLSSVSTDDDLDSIIAGLGSTSISSSSALKTLSVGDKKLLIEKGGQVVPQSSIIELATISQRRAIAGELDWEDRLPQLLLSQTTNHYLGVHERGCFVEVQKRGLSSPVLISTKRKVDPVIKQLRSALEEIRKMVAEHGESARLSLVCRNGRLEVFERQSDESCLPAEYLKKYST